MEDCNILIIGGTGSLGRELTSYLGFKNRIGIFSRDENKQWTMKREYPNATYFIGDVRNKTSMVKTIHRFKPNIIIFAAAQKHIDVCETEVSESIDTNIFGIRNLIEILESQPFSFVNTVLFISTDKACNPINVYGQCKAIAEKLMIEASKTMTQIKFVCVRYGNVINSRGSLIPLFKDIAKDPTKNHFPITVNGMTRFFMSLGQAMILIEKCIIDGKNGEIWLFLARSLHIDHIAKYFSLVYDKPVVTIGIRPGEKIHEELYSPSEESRSRSEGDFLVITQNITKPYEECKGLRSDFHIMQSYDFASGIISNMVNLGTLQS